MQECLKEFIKLKKINPTQEHENTYNVNFINFKNIINFRVFLITIINDTLIMQLI